MEAYGAVRNRANSEASISLLTRGQAGLQQQSPISVGERGYRRRFRTKFREPYPGRSLGLRAEVTGTVIAKER
jgi:hypothetical protein